MIIKYHGILITQCILCVTNLKKEEKIKILKYIDNNMYELIFDKKNCLDLFEKFSGVYGDEFCLELLLLKT
jgi:hypothetical protein